MESQDLGSSEGSQVIDSIGVERHRITVEVPLHTYSQYRKLLETTQMTRTQLIILLIEKGYESIIRLESEERAA